MAFQDWSWTPQKKKKENSKSEIVMFLMEILLEYSLLLYNTFLNPTSLDLWVTLPSGLYTNVPATAFDMPPLFIYGVIFIRKFSSLTCFSNKQTIKLIYIFEWGNIF